MMNASILRQVRTVRAPNPLETAFTGADLKSRILGNQSKEMEIADNQRKLQQGEAIHQALIEAGGDVERALPKIAQVAPELLPHYQDYVNQQRQQRITQSVTARKAQEENISALEHTAAPEITAAAPQATSMSYPGQVGQGPTLGGGTQQVDVPLPEQQVSGIPDLGVAGYKKRPTSLQAWLRQQNEAARNKAALDREANTVTVTDPTTGKPIAGPKDLVDNILTQIGENARNKGPKATFEEETYQDYLRQRDLISKYGANRVGFENYKRAQKEASEEGGAINLTPAGLDAAANAFAKTGQLPPMGMGKAGAAIRSKIINRAAELVPDLDLAANKADFKANQDSLAALQKNRDAVVAFENTASKNLDNFLKTAQGIVDTGSPWINKPLRQVEQRALGNADLIAFNAARQVAINEIAKVTSNPGLTGQLSDSARHEVEAFIPADATLAQILAVAKILKSDMKSRHDSLDDQIGAIRQRIKGGGGGGNTGGTVRMIAPNGQEKDVPADQVEHYTSLGAKVK